MLAPPRLPAPTGRIWRSSTAMLTATAHFAYVSLNTFIIARVRIIPLIAHRSAGQSICYPGRSGRRGAKDKEHTGAVGGWATR